MSPSPRATAPSDALRDDAPQALKCERDGGYISVPNHIKHRTTFAARPLVRHDARARACARTRAPLFGRQPAKSNSYDMVSALQVIETTDHDMPTRVGDVTFEIVGAMQARYSACVVDAFFVLFCARCTRMARDAARTRPRLRTV